MAEAKVRKNLQIALTAVAILWFVHLLNVLLPVDLRSFGIQPRRLDGLWGILFTAFLHGDLGHLIANSGALFVLLTVSLSFSRKLTIVALLIISLLGGGLVWIFGRGNTVHIGASGIIFGLISFLVSMGLFRRNWKALIFSIAVFFFYGGVFISLFRYLPGVSWAGHFFGFLSGVMAAWWTKTYQTSLNS